MKIFFLLFLLLCSQSFFGQNIPKKNDRIEIQLISHYKVKRRPDLANRKNKPYLIIYFDSLGNILEKTEYGRHTNPHLRPEKSLAIYTYNNKILLDSVIEYTSGKLGNQTKIHPIWKTKYFYDTRNQLIQELKFNLQADSLFAITTYEYDSLGNKIRILFNPTYYYLNKFDKNNKLYSTKQIYDTKVQWEWIYNYNETSRIGIFQTYYDQGRNYAKKEIRLYQNGYLKQIEEKYTSEDGLASKTILYYDQTGIISKVEKYESYSSNVDYELKYFIIVKNKHVDDSTKNFEQKVNDEIFNDVAF